jgi:hypothetical protein
MNLYVSLDLCKVRLSLLLAIGSFLELLLLDESSLFLNALSWGRSTLSDSGRHCDVSSWVVRDRKKEEGQSKRSPGLCTMLYIRKGGKGM